MPPSFRGVRLYLLRSKNPIRFEKGLSQGSETKESTIIDIVLIIEIVNVFSVLGQLRVFCEAKLGEAWTTPKIL